MVSKKISKNKKRVMDLFNNTSDLIIHELKTHSNIKTMICYIEGFIDRDLLNRDILKPIMFDLDKPKNIDRILYISQIKKIESVEDIIDYMNYGNVCLFFEGSNIIYAIEINNWEKRNVEEPSSESVVRGPKEGFIEDILTNKSMLRRKLRNNNLVFEDYMLGKQTKTKISLAYIKGIVNEKILAEVKKRLDRIDIDSILESGYIEELIEDAPISLFSTIYNSEKPDIVAGKILEGKVAIFADGTPHVLIVPRILVEGIMASEDYYLSPFYASFLRLLRFASLIIAIYLPGIFIALQLYHQEMIPTVLLISMVGARAGVPFPVALEILLMTVAFELTKESGLRLPKSIGQTVSIVGALILGQAVVEAEIVSGITIIVVSVAAIAEFIIPELVQSVVIYRFVIIFLGAFAGIYGIVCGFMVITTQVVSMDSFGVPFSWPLAPRSWGGLKRDTFIKMSLRKDIFRPKAIEKMNLRRQNPPRGR